MGREDTLYLCSKCSCSIEFFIQRHIVSLFSTSVRSWGQKCGVESLSLYPLSWSGSVCARKEHATQCTARGTCFRAQCLGRKQGWSQMLKGFVRCSWRKIGKMKRNTIEGFYSGSDKNLWEHQKIKITRTKVRSLIQGFLPNDVPHLRCLSRALLCDRNKLSKIQWSIGCVSLDDG